MTETRTTANTKLGSGCGYWDTTHFDIGGAFRRAGADGKAIKRIIREFSRVKGCDTLVEFTDGSTGAIDSAHIRQVCDRCGQIDCHGCAYPLT